MATEHIKCINRHESYYSIGDVGFLIYHEDADGRSTYFLQEFPEHTNPGRLLRLEGWLCSDDGGHFSALGVARIEGRERSGRHLLVRKLEEDNEVEDALNVLGYSYMMDAVRAASVERL